MLTHPYEDPVNGPQIYNSQYIAFIFLGVAEQINRGTCNFFLVLENIFL